MSRLSENFLLSGGHAGACKKFSKVSSIVISHSDIRSELAIQNLLVKCRKSQKAALYIFYIAN